MKAPRKDAWTDAELQIIYDHVNEKDAARRLMRLLPGRSGSAIAVKLTKLREEAKIKTPRSHRPSDSKVYARNGSLLLAQAIEKSLSKPVDKSVSDS